MEIKVVKDILGANEQIAERNRQLLDSKGVLAVNLMSSPGAGDWILLCYNGYTPSCQRGKEKCKMSSFIMSLPSG